MIGVMQNDVHGTDPNKKLAKGAYVNMVKAKNLPKCSRYRYFVSPVDGAWHGNSLACYAEDVKPLERGKLFHGPEQFSPRDDVRAMDTVAFWHGDGYSTILQFCNEAWLLYVYEDAPEQFRIIQDCKIN